MADMMNANRTYLCCKCKTTKRLKKCILDSDVTICPICHEPMDFLGTIMRIPKNNPKGWKNFIKYLSTFESEHFKKIVSKLKLETK